MSISTNEILIKLVSGRVLGLVSLKQSVVEQSVVAQEIQDGISENLKLFIADSDLKRVSS